MIIIKLDLTRAQLESNLRFVQSIAAKANVPLNEHNAVAQVLEEIFSSAVEEEEKEDTKKSKKKKSEEIS